MIQQYAFTPTAGKRIGSVVVDGVNKGKLTSYTFSNVTAGHTVVVNFVPDTSTITASTETNGSISPEGLTTVNRGGSQTYAITPAAGYKVYNVVVNGSSKGAQTFWTFSNVTSNQKISVSFTKQ